MKNILLVTMLCVGVGWWALSGFGWAANPKSVKSREQTVAVSAFEQAIYSALTHQYGRPHHHMSVRIIFPKEPVKAPSGKLHLEIEKLSGGARMGRRSFRIGLFVNGQIFKTLNVVATVKAQATVTTPIRWIKPKEIISTEDVTVMKIDVPSLTHDFLLDQSDVIGKQVLRPLPPRQPIRKILLDDPPVVHKGDRVMLEVRRKGLIVQTIGVANASGKSGETIPVKNKSSGREIIGTVISAGLVEVGF